MRKRGRPTKLTLEVQEKIVAALRLGATMETAAHHAGTHRDSIYSWLERGGAESKGPYATFLERTRRARADCQLSALAIIKKALIAGDVNAAKFILERRFPNDFGPRSHHQIEASVEGRMSAEDARVEFESLMARITESRAEKEGDD